MRLDLKIKICLFLIILVSIIVILTITPKKQEKVVVVYVSHDQDYSEPILKEFEKKYEVRVTAVYDTEATKSVGLVNRILAEKSNPQADVFWNNEPIGTVYLKKAGVLEPYCSPNAKDIPEQFKDKDCYWTGFAARARVIIYNTRLINESEAPKSIYDFLDPKWKGKACIADPRFGSTRSHIASLFALLGVENAKKLLEEMVKNDVKVVASNSMVRDMVVAGKCWFGLTDTDDAFDAIRENKPIKIIFPDQDSFGTFVFPNTVMLIKGAKHKEEAKLLIDYLLSPEVERKLAQSALQLPLKTSVRNNVTLPIDWGNVKSYEVNFEEVCDYLNISQKYAKEILLKIK